ETRAVVSVVAANRPGCSAPPPCPPDGPVKAGDTAGGSLLGLMGKSPPVKPPPPETVLLIGSGEGPGGSLAATIGEPVPGGALREPVVTPEPPATSFCAIAGLRAKSCIDSRTATAPGVVGRKRLRPVSTGSTGTADQEEDGASRLRYSNFNVFRS